MHLSHHHFTTYLQCKLGSSRSAFSDRLPSPTKEPFAVEKWPKTVCLEADCLPNHPTCCLYESFLARCVIIQPHRTIQPGLHSCRSTQICQSHDVPCSIGGIFVEGTVHLNGLLNRSLDLDSAGPAFVDSCDTVQSAQA